MKDLFGKMTDAEFDKFMKDFLSNEDKNFYLEIEEFKTQPNMDDIVDAANVLKIPLEEYVMMPFVDDDPELGPVMTQQKVIVGYFPKKRVQQSVTKKNSMSTDISARDSKTNQVIGTDKNARSSDVENFSLATIGADKTAKELNGPRADDMVMKQEFYTRIARDGYVDSSDIVSDPLNKSALNTVDVYFTCAGIKTNLITDGLLLPRTVMMKRGPKSIGDKYE